MKRVTIEVKLLIGCTAVKRFSSEARCATPADMTPLFKSVKKELDKWEKEEKSR